MVVTGDGTTSLAPCPRVEEEEENEEEGEVHEERSFSLPLLFGLSPRLQ